MTIKLLHTDQCHIWKTALDELEAALAELGTPVSYQIVRIDSTEQAHQERFSGSPTITIDGVDVDPAARNLTNFGVSSCRPYLYEGQSFEYPPKLMILTALKSTRGDAN